MEFNAMTQNAFKIKVKQAKLFVKNNKICYEIKGKLCPRAGNSRSEESYPYVGETAHNFHTRRKEHSTKQKKTK